LKAGSKNLEFIKIRLMKIKVIFLGLLFIILINQNVLTHVLVVHPIKEDMCANHVLVLWNFKDMNVYVLIEVLKNMVMGRNVTKKKTCYTISH